MDVLEWFRGVEVIVTCVEADDVMPPDVSKLIVGPRLISALVFDTPVELQSDEALDWSLTIRPVKGGMVDFVPSEIKSPSYLDIHGAKDSPPQEHLQKAIKTDWGAMPDSYRKEREKDAEMVDTDWSYDPATGLHIQPEPSDEPRLIPPDERLVQEAVLLTVEYAACPNASYNSAHYDNPQGCKWCARRKAVLEYLKNSS
jgi:hypothetical protein